MKLRSLLYTVLILLISTVLLIPNFVQKTAVISIVIVGYFLYPEASKVVAHYCFGNGDTLHLNPNYIRQSNVIVQKLNTMKIGESREVRFKQKEDWRLSYALNPFNITKTEEGATIHQYIKFRGEDYTYLNFLGHKLKVSDNIVHVFDCKPYVVICQI